MDVVTTLSLFLYDVVCGVASNILAEDVRARMDLLAHREFTNHDIGEALFLSWQRSVKTVFAGYLVTNDFASLNADAQAGLKEQEIIWRSRKVFDEIFRAERQVAALGGTEDVQDWLVRDIPGVNRLVTDRLVALGRLDPLPGGLRNRVETMLASTLIFNFIEIGVKRNEHSRDAVFYHLLVELGREMGHVGKQVDELANRAYAGVLDHPDLHPWMKDVASQLGDLRNDVQDLRSEIERLRADIAKLRHAGDASQADVLERRLEQMVKEAASDALREEMNHLLDDVMARFETLLARQPRADVDTATRLRAFLYGATGRFRGEALLWAENIIPLETVYTQQRALHKLEDGAGQSASLDAVLDATRFVLLLGEPGAGKTTALRAYGLRLAQSCRFDQSGVTDGMIPVYMSMRDYDAFERFKPGNMPNRLLAFIRRFMPVLPETQQEELLETGQIALLMDGLDEITDSLLRGQVVREIQSFATTHLGQACQIIVTSRSLPYERSQDHLATPFQAWTVAPLDATEQKILAQRWLTALVGPTQGESLYNDLLGEMVHRPAIERTLRCPLLMTMLLAVYAAVRKIEGPARRYEYLADVLLLRSMGIRGVTASSLEPARQRELAETKSRLGWLAFRSLEMGGRMDRPAAVHEMIALGISPDTADAFLRQVESAGLVKFSSGMGESLLSFIPHATFQDFFAGYHLFLGWNKPSIRSQIEKRISLISWEAPSGFCFDLIGQDAAWPMLMKVLRRAPLSAARLLQDGMELTYEGLPRPRREMIFKTLRQRAWEVLQPIPGVLLLRLRLLAPDRETVYGHAFKLRQDAVDAAGELKVSEFGPLMVNAALQVPWLMHKFVPAMIKMGPRGLWPELQAWLTAQDDLLGLWARRVIVQWEGREAQDIHRFLLEHSQWQDIGLEAMASQESAESQTVLQNAMQDPALSEQALRLGLEHNRPGLAQAGLNWFEQHPEYAYPFGRNLVHYLARQPLPEAVAGIRRLLSFGTDSQRLRDIFESADEDILVPLLAIFAELAQGADENMLEALDTAIYQAFKCNHLDARYGDAPDIIEKMILRGNRSTRQYFCRKFDLRPLSAAACAMILDRIDVHSPYPGYYNSMEILEHLPPIPEPWRGRIIAKLRPGLQIEKPHYFVAFLLAGMGVRDAEVINYLMDSALPKDGSSGNVHSINVLLDQGIPATYPLVVRGLGDQKRYDVDPQKAISALGRMWSGLTTAQREESRALLCKRLNKSDWFIKMQVVDTLGRIGSRDAAAAILDIVSEGTLDPEEILCGRALGRMGWYANLENTLWAGFQTGQEHICRTMIYAWRMSGEAQAGRYLLRTLGPVQIKNVPHRLYSADLASQYMRGQAACELGWLAADLAQRQHHGRLVDAWACVAKELGHDGIEPLAQKALNAAKGAAHPSQSLFDEARHASGTQAETLMYLCAAYEWSEVILALLVGDDADTAAIWKRLQDFFDKDNTPKRLSEMQTALATRLDWKGPDRPFDNLARLHREVEYGFQRMVYDFSDYARRWVDWFDWQRDQLR